MLFNKESTGFWVLAPRPHIELDAVTHIYRHSSPMVRERETGEFSQLHGPVVRCPVTNNVAKEMARHRT